MRRLLSLSTVVGTLFAFGTTVGAVANAEPFRTRSIEIRYADLDLSSQAAIQTLYARLATAAELACGAYDVRNVRDRLDWRACYEAALADAVAGVPNEALAALHRTARGRSGVNAGHAAPVG